MNLENFRDEHKAARLYRDVSDEENLKHLSDGYIHEVNDKFALLSLIGDGIRFDSFCVIKLEDIVDAKVSPRHDFYQRVFHQRGKLPIPPALDLTSMKSVIDSFVKKASIPLLVVHIRNDEDVCWIGQVTKCTEDAVDICEIDCDGEYTEIESYPLKDITHITFDGPYEEALWIASQANQVATK